jgi:Mn2+/Fe2+ NRAMP family transporter
MSKKLTSTLLLFAVFIGFLFWGLWMLTSSLATQPRNGEAMEEVVYALLILMCSFVALVAILKLPRKNQ